jgi:4a-hydroxytetrahydrobiopterin dehydratase
MHKDCAGSLPICNLISVSASFGRGSSIVTAARMRHGGDKDSVSGLWHSPRPAFPSQSQEIQMAAYKILSEAEIESELKKLPDWSVKKPNIEASFEFQTFRDAIAFIVEVAIDSEVANHHPEFFNSYNKVSFSFCTHDAGHKITDLDIAMADRISKMAKRFISMK